MLHTIDFIHLADFLLKPYSATSPQELYALLSKATTVDDLESAKRCMPESNWTRYFSKLVDCEDLYLQKRWSELYELRCKVAHNAIVTKHDDMRIRELVSELQSKLEDAISNLPQVKVPEAEVDVVAENAAINTSQLLGEFVVAWRSLEALLFAAAHSLSYKVRFPLEAIEALRKDGHITQENYVAYRRLQQIKNHILHPTGVVISDSNIQDATCGIGILSQQIKDSTPGIHNESNA